MRQFRCEARFCWTEVPPLQVVKNTCVFRTKKNANEQSCHRVAFIAGYRCFEYLCNDVNECRESSHTCSADATCLNNPGSFRCTCWPGYTGNGFNCSFVGDCSDGTVTCSPRARCVPRSNTGTFQCKCKQHFDGDGISCSFLGCPVSNSVNCVGCGAGERMTTSGDCEPCPEDMYSEVGDECVPCPNGTSTQGNLKSTTCSRSGESQDVCQSCGAKHPCPSR